MADTMATQESTEGGESRLAAAEEHFGDVARDVLRRVHKALGLAACVETCERPVLGQVVECTLEDVKRQSAAGFAVKDNGTWSETASRAYEAALRQLAFRFIKRGDELSGLAKVEREAREARRYYDAGGR